MTWSARSRSDGGMVSPSALAVLRLTNPDGPAARRTGRVHAGPPGVRLLRQRLGPSLGDLRVLLGRHAGDADCAYDLAIDDDGNAAFERARAGERQQTEVRPALRDEVLEHLGGPPVEDGGVCLLAGCFDATELRAIEPVHGDQMAARIEDGDDD